MEEAPMGLVRDWGSTAEERARSYACDRHLDGATGALYRAVDVDAPPEVVFRWLCQLRVAPYSYDWIDNGGRVSPRARDAKNEQLAVGQTVMSIFRLVEFERDRHLTILLDHTRVFGGVAVTYHVEPRGGGDGTRLVAKLAVRNRRWSPLRLLLPLGDFIMMRKQLLTLKALAEREFARGRATGAPT